MEVCLLLCRLSSQISCEHALVLRQVWSAEEEYLIMRVTLNAVRILKQWMQRCEPLKGSLIKVGTALNVGGAEALQG